MIINGISRDAMLQRLQICDRSQSSTKSGNPLQIQLLYAVTTAPELLVDGTLMLLKKLKSSRSLSSLLFTSGSQVPTLLLHTCCWYPAAAVSSVEAARRFYSCVPTCCCFLLSSYYSLVTSSGKVSLLFKWCTATSWCTTLLYYLVLYNSTDQTFSLYPTFA